MTVHTANKKLLARFLTEIADRPSEESAAKVAAYCYPDVLCLQAECDDDRPAVEMGK